MNRTSAAVILVGLTAVLLFMIVVLGSAATDIADHLRALSAAGDAR